MKNIEDIHEIQAESVVLTLKQTKHFLKDRYDRYTKIRNQVGIGNVVKGFRWDKKHRNGAEKHFITNTGIILVINERTNKLITMLIARPQQIRRYWELQGKQTPKDVQPIIEKAIEHQRKGYNETF